MKWEEITQFLLDYLTFNWDVNLLNERKVSINPHQFFQEENYTKTFIEMLKISTNPKNQYVSNVWIKNLNFLDTQQTNFKFQFENISGNFCRNPQKFNLRAWKFLKHTTNTSKPTRNTNWQHFHDINKTSKIIKPIINYLSRALPIWSIIIIYH